MTIVSRRILRCAVFVAAAPVLGAQATSGNLPIKYVGPATTAAITAGDLMTRLYIFADDSMRGRAVGTEDNIRATAYIEREVRRLGLKPGGDDGGYFQDLPLRTRGLDPASTVTIDGRVFKAGEDFLASSGGLPRKFDNTQVIWGGMALDTLDMLTPDQVRGRILLLRQFVPPPGFNITAFAASRGYRAYLMVIGEALTTAIVGAVAIPPAAVQNSFNPTAIGMDSPVSSISFSPTLGLAEAMMGQPLATVAKGTLGKMVSSDIRFIDTPKKLGRNVVAILPGSDPKLRGQYIAIGAHNDHVGFNMRPVEHDSLKAYNAVKNPAGAEGGHPAPLTADEWTKINADIANLRKIYPSRPDSIFNGADDDGTGSVSVLEIAEAFAKGNVKPKRSILFVWHAGEERGMWGSGYFMDRPTVPRDSIVAQLNIDMIGRGAAADVTGEGKDGGVLHGGDRYVQLVGSHRLSTELGDLVEKVNTEKKYNFLLDYNIDADGHPQNIYCRSDHWSYAKWGVPVVFFTTGGHADYHQVTDEPQYIRYDHMAAINHLIFDVAVRAANLDHRVIVDKAKPSSAPATECKQ